jgi:hypothetical protein
MLLNSAKKCDSGRFPPLTRDRHAVVSAAPVRNRDVYQRRGGLHERAHRCNCAVISTDEPGGERRSYEAPVMGLLRRDDPLSFADIADAIASDRAS